VASGLAPLEDDDTGRASLRDDRWQETIVADAMEAVGERMEQEAADELESRDGHHLGLVVMAVVSGS